ncbi:TVP38/TMEM64 family protein [Oceanobacillus bengalensis]|uniref:TVP38/TMEM64 family membrane protein n=1 Tax=Oceanobacillus bengalensis TaxID=1435466 RepID=A0A494YRI0_9BACI|nr:VTT domain-containing protein [Oceanobacillus bengalensis]RKQ12078.1 TVP38/TMEM64 family protein [Oceanobacillus bengalensis]
MELFGNYIMAFIETGGVFGPLLFISFHLLRPLLFLPVVFICISGGVVFGPVAGTVYSIIGITLSSIFFYLIIRWKPKQFERLTHLKQKLLGKYGNLSKAQITVLRLVPFIHFHLLSLCLIEITSGLKDYMKSSFLSSIPLAFVYTSVGGWISNLSPIYIFTFLIALLPLIYLLRTKEMIIKWQDFFQVST